MSINSIPMLSPFKVTVFFPFTKTGATGVSPVPGRLIPKFAIFDSPGPFTTQPITATVISSTPWYLVFQLGILSLKYNCMSPASFWKKVEVVLPHPGQAITIGVKARIPIV